LLECRIAVDEHLLHPSLGFQRRSVENDKVGIFPPATDLLPLRVSKKELLLIYKYRSYVEKRPLLGPGHADGTLCCPHQELPRSRKNA
jgi:hypothetical protein